MATAQEVDKGHGRIETRRIRVLEPRGLSQSWPGLAQICQLERERLVGQNHSRELVYAITSLTHEHTGATALLHLSRSHWGIENRVHAVRDVTFAEDRCRTRTGALPQLLAAARNTAMTLIRRCKFPYINHGLEYFNLHRGFAINLVTKGRIK